MEADSGKDPGAAVPPLPASGEIPDLREWSPDPKPLSQDSIQHGVSYLPRVKNEHASCGGPNIMVPLLKHWTALPALSYFLTNSMHARESSQRISAPFSFKPPPRVAMPDKKQEVWLADLANPAYPLKRLGRTVPAGLRGYALLDSCCFHSVPVARLVWLVRCYGANEIRALRRKHADESENEPSPASAFLSGWTDDMVEFMHDGIADWAKSADPARLGYTMNAMRALFEEMLIDRTRVFDWLIHELYHRDAGDVPALVHAFNEIFGFLAEPQATQLARAVALRSDGVAHSPATLAAMDALLLRLFVACRDAFTVPALWPRFEQQLRRAADLPALLARVRSDRQSVLALIETMRERNDVFSFVRSVPADWAAAAKVGQLLTGFTVPFSVPDLVGELRRLRLATPALFASLLQWTLCKASLRAVHLCVAVCQQLAAHGLQLHDCLVECLMQLAPLQCTRTLYTLLGWLYRSGIFRPEAYFRRLIASGTLHLHGAPRDCHELILRNLPFSLMGRDLCNQALMLLGAPLAQRDLKSIAAEILGFNSSSTPLPNDLSRDQQLVLAAELLSQYTALAPENVTPLLCARVVEALDQLGDKYTTFQVVWHTLSSAADQDLYMFAHLVSLQNLYYFVCMRVSNALIQVVYSRRGDFVVSINEPSFENLNIIMMLRSALKDQPDNHVNMYLRSLESIVTVSTMTPDAMDDDMSLDAGAGSLIEAALAANDRAQLLHLRAHYARSPFFMQRVRDWLASRGRANADANADANANACSCEFIVWLVANSCIAYSDVYNCLIDARDETLFDAIFAPAAQFKLSAMEAVHLEIIRQKFTLLAPPEEIYYLLSKITSIPRLELAVTLLLGRIRYDSERFSQMLLAQIPDSPDKDACLERVVARQLGLTGSAGDRAGDRHSYLLQLLGVCNAFNIGLCQIGAWLNYKDCDPELVAAEVLELVGSGRLPATSSLQVVFSYLSPETRRAVQDAAELEFLTGEIPHPHVNHLLQILGNIDSFQEKEKEEQQHDKGLRLIECVARTVEACTALAKVDARIHATIRVLLKLINLECTGSGTGPGASSNMYLPTVAAMLPSLQQLPVIAQDAALSQMISDCLRILNRQDSLQTTITSNTSALEGLVLYSGAQKTYSALDVSAFDLIEETGAAGNDAPIDLAKFEAYLEH